MDSDFAEKVKQFVKRAESLKDSITTEEATKTSLIMPFFSMLGYDVFNPDEFLPEFTADVGIKKGEKVDYAILQNGKPVIIIEAKAITKNLDKHGSQLFRYFSTTPAKFGILTNGIQYRFFTDLDVPNKMDDVPFLDINILSISPNQMAELQKFEKSNFDINQTQTSASMLKYAEVFRNMLAEQFEYPSDALVRFFLQDVYVGVKTQGVVDRFRPILKSAMQEFLGQTMSDKIQNAFSQPSPPAAPQTDHLLPSLTEEELEAYHRLCKLFSDYVDPSDITYKKTESYTGILYKNSTRKWICRLVFSDSQKIIIVPGEDKREIRCRISNLYELGNYSRYMVSVIARYTDLLKPLEPEHPDVYQLVLKRRFPKRTACANS